MRLIQNKYKLYLKKYNNLMNTTKINKKKTDYLLFLTQVYN